MKNMKVWITKYALTEGIIEADAETKHCAPGMISVPSMGMHANFHGGDGKDWHSTLESAKKKAEKMRIGRISSLKKSIAKLEALKFE